MQKISPFYPLCEGIFCTAPVFLKCYDSRFTYALEDNTEFKTL